MAYNRNPHRRNIAGGGNNTSNNGSSGDGQNRQPVPIKPFIVLFAILLFALVAYKLYKPVVNTITDFIEDISPNDDPYNTGEQPNNDNDIAIMDDLPVEEGDTTEVVMFDDIAVAAPEEPAGKPEQPVKEKPQPIPVDVKPVEPKPAEPKPEDISKYQIERFVDQQTGKYGLKDVTANKILVEAQYDEIKSPKYSRKITSYVIAIKNKLWGIVSIKGEVLVPFEYDYIYDWCDKYPDYYELYKRDYSDAATNRGTNHLYGLVYAPSGKITVPVEYYGLEYAERYNISVKGLIIAQRPDKQKGIITMNNEIKVPFEYYNISGVSINNHLKLSQCATAPNLKCQYGLLRLTDCKIIIPLEYDELEVVGPASFIRVKKDGLYGCINDRNQIIVPFQKVSGVGMSQGGSDSSNNRVWFSLPDGTMACYNIKGERVPCD